MAHLVLIDIFIPPDPGRLQKGTIEWEKNKNKDEQTNVRMSY